MSGALETGAAVSVAAAASLVWVWRAPGWAVAPLLLTWMLLGARIWLMAACRMADRRLAEADALARWQYEPGQWQEALQTLRRASVVGLLPGWMVRLKYRDDPADERSIVLLDTGAVFGGADWWRWDGGFRLGGAALFRGPTGPARLLIQLRALVPLRRWTEREIFYGPQVTLAIPVPPGEEERAVRIASYLVRRRG